MASAAATASAAAVRAAPGGSALMSPLMATTEPLSPPVVKRLLLQHPARVGKTWPPPRKQQQCQRAQPLGVATDVAGVAGDAELGLMADAESTILGLHW